MKEEFWCCIIFGTRSNKLSFFWQYNIGKEKQQQMRSTKIIIQIERRSGAEAACSESAGGSSDREAGRHDQEDHAGDRHQHLRVQVSPLPNQAHQSFSKFLSEQQSRNEMGVLSPYEVALNLERTITVKGPTIDAVSQAESRISQKLRQSFETDLQQRVSELWRGQTEMRREIQMQLGIGAAASGLPMLPGGMINPFSMDLAALSLAGRTGIMTQPHLGLAAAGLPSTNSNSNATKTLRMYVPNNMVGAIIGSKVIFRIL